MSRMSWNSSGIELVNRLLRSWLAEELNLVHGPQNFYDVEVGVKKCQEARARAFVQARTIKYDSLSACAKSGNIYFLVDFHENRFDIFIFLRF